MPSKTAKQHRAMEAAAHGESNIGSPKSVGQAYAAADEAKKHQKPKPNGPKKLADYLDGH